MKLPIAVDFITIRPCFTDEFDLSVIFLRPIAERSLLPRIVTARMGLQTPAHNPNGKLVPMLGDKRVSHLFGMALEPMAGLCLALGEIRCGRPPEN